MPFNGSGVFQRIYSWVNDAAGGIKIRADRMDAEQNGIATGLSNCITKDGQTTVTATLPMATYKHTGVGLATNRTDYARYDQVQDGVTNWVVATGTVNVITANYTIPITALVDGQLCFIRAIGANTSTTPSFSPNGLTARTIVKDGGGALLVGDIAGVGHELVLRYNLANTRWELLNSAGDSLGALAFLDTVGSSEIDANAITQTKILNNEISIDKFNSGVFATLAHIVSSTVNRVVKADVLRQYITSWEIYTPTFTGFGTASNIVARWRRVGDTLELDFKFQVGTPTAVEAQMTLPTGLTVDSTKVPSVMFVGSGVYNINTTSTLGVMATGGDAFVNFGVGGVASSAFVVSDGNVVGASGQLLGFSVRIPITGW